MRGRTLIVNLPGSPAAAKEGLDATLPALLHALSMMRGASHPASDGVRGKGKP